MSNPVESLRRLIAPSSPMRGVVVAVEDGVAKVATRRGLMEYPAPDGLLSGDQVAITAEGNIKKTSANRYWA